MRKYNRYTEDFNGVDYSLDHEAIEDTILKQQVEDKVVIGYLAYDNYACREDLMDDDYSGQLLSFHRHSKNVQEGYEALGLDRYGERNLEQVWSDYSDEAVRRYLAKVVEAAKADNFTLQAFVAYLSNDEYVEDEEAALKWFKDDATCDNRWDCVHCESLMKEVLEDMHGEAAYFPGDIDAVLLDCYEHSSIYWSLAGGGTQCQWDTANGAGVWVPSDEQRKELDKAEDRKAKRLEFAEQFLDTYNDVNNGNVYGVIVQTYSREGDNLDEDACWGYVGSEYAEEELTSQFKYTCEKLKKDYDIAVKTQNGKQLEIAC